MGREQPEKPPPGPAEQGGADAEVGRCTRLGQKDPLALVQAARRQRLRFVEATGLQMAVDAEGFDAAVGKNEVELRVVEGGVGGMDHGVVVGTTKREVQLPRQ